MSPGGPSIIHDVQRETETRPVADLFHPVVLLFKVEVVAAVIVAPAFKIKLAAGVNNPGISARMH